MVEQSAEARPVLALAALGLAATAGVAQGAALERAVPQVVRLLYEDGTYGEFGLSFVDPHQSGEGAVLPTPLGPLAVPGNTGDLFQSQTNYFAAIKGDIGERLSYVLGFDQPHGVADPATARAASRRRSSPMPGPWGGCTPTS